MQVLNWILIAVTVKHLKPGHVKLQRKVYLWVDLSNALGVFNSWIQRYFVIDKIFIRLHNLNLISYHCKDENFPILCHLHNKTESCISGVSEHFVGHRLPHKMSTWTTLTLKFLQILTSLGFSILHLSSSQAYTLLVYFLSMEKYMFMLSKKLNHQI